MSHPILITALAEDRHRWCPCGVVAQLPCGPCRECHVAATSRRETVRTSRCGGPNWARAGTMRARLVAWIMSSLQIISKGARN